MTVGGIGGVELYSVIVVAALATGLLFGASLLALRARRTRQHLLISVALGALWTRSLLGMGTALGHVPMPVHHYVAHGIDFLIGSLILYAVYAYSPGSFDGVTKT